MELFVVPKSIPTALLLIIQVLWCFAPDWSVGHQQVNRDYLKG
jgi:hypothetical protein